LIIAGMGFFAYFEYFNEEATFHPQIALFEKDNTTIVKNILQKYYQDHTYSKKDLFVCSDMATDVWNMVKSKGFDAKIKIGNIDNSTKDEELNFSQYNHAWVMARIDNSWYALETTGGFIAAESQYPLYYRKTIEFGNPLEFKNYLDLIKTYNIQANILNNISQLCGNIYEDYTKEHRYYNTLVDAWNKKYAGKPVSTEADLLNEKLQKQQTVMKEKETLYNGCILTTAEIQNQIDATNREIENKNK